MNSSVSITLELPSYGDFWIQLPSATVKGVVWEVVIKAQYANINVAVLSHIHSVPVGALCEDRDVTRAKLVVRDYCLSDLTLGILCSSIFCITWSL